MTFIFTIGVLAIVALTLADPNHGFHRRHSARGRPEFIDLDKYFILRCRGEHKVSGAYDDFASAFRYARSIVAFAMSNCMSLAGYRSVHYGSYIILDLDGTEAFAHAKLLYRFLIESLCVPVEGLLIFFSGNRGIHFYLDTNTVGAEASDRFYLYAKMFCSHLAEEAGIVIDMAVYGPLQLVRSPNARHTSSGLYKILLLPKELFEMVWEDVREMAKQPRYLELSLSTMTALPGLTKRWADCVVAVNDSLKKINKVKARPVATNSTPQSPSERKVRAHSFVDNFQMYHTTRDFLLNGAPGGERHTRLVAAAKNFADFGPGAKGLAYALLFPAAFLSGLPEPEIRNVIEWAFKERG